MAFAPDTSTFLLVTPDTGDLPNSRILTADASAGNLQFTDSGPGGALTLAPTLNLLAVAGLTTPGFVSYSGSNSFTRPTLTSTGTISITNATGVGNPVLDMVEGASVQKVNIQNNGSFHSTRSTLNFINGLNASVTVVDNGAQNRTDITVNATGDGSGTVTSVGLSSTGLTLNVTGSPITTSGTINVDLKTANSPAVNKVLTVTGVAPLVLSWVEGDGTGTVTSVAASSTTGLTIGGSPITGAGTLTINLPSPTAGALLVGNGSAYASVALGTAGQVLTSFGGTAAWRTGTSGTVTSVAVASTTGLVVTGSPVTGSGTINVNLPAATAGNFLQGNGTVYAPLVIGADRYVLTSNGASAAWEPLPPAVGSAAQAVLSTGGVLVVANTDITADSVIVAGGQTSGVATPAAGPVTVTLNPGVGFTLTGDSGDAGKGVGYTIDGGGGGGGGSGTVTSVGLTSTGLTLAVTGSASPITGAGTFNVDLKTANSPSLNNVLTVTGTSPLALSWSPTAAAWYTIPAGNNISIGAFGVNNSSFYQLVDNASPPSPPTTGGVFSINLGVLHINSSGPVSGARPIVTSNPTNYAAVGSILLGDGNQYTPLVIGASGRVLTSNGTTASWVAPSGGSAVFGFGQLTTVASTLVVADAAVTVNCIVVVSGAALTGANTPATGPYDVTITAGVGFTIAGKTGVGTDEGNYVTYIYQR